jgi:putative transposase
VDLGQFLGLAELAGRLTARAEGEGVSLVGPGGLLAGLTKTVIETALGAEMTKHVGYDAHDPVGRHSGTPGAKTVLTEIGPLDLDVPRDRAGTFEPVIGPRRRRRLGGVDAMVCSLSAKGLTHGEISAKEPSTGGWHGSGAFGSPLLSSWPARS